MLEYRMLEGITAAGRSRTARKAGTRVGVRHAREYKEILRELTDAVGGIADSYTFFGMDEAEWDATGDAERRETLEALADDVFYGLGEQSAIAVGEGTVVYHPKHHVIEVAVDGKESRIVRLV